MLGREKFPTCLPRCQEGIGHLLFQLIGCFEPGSLVRIKVNGKTSVKCVQTTYRAVSSIALGNES